RHRRMRDIPCRHSGRRRRPQDLGRPGVVRHRIGRLHQTCPGGGLRCRVPHPLRRSAVSSGHRLARPAPVRPRRQQRAVPPMSPQLEQVRHWLTSLQSKIVNALEETGGAPFSSDAWTRPEGGGGLSRYLENGPVLERAAVLFSHVQGRQLPPSASALRPHLAGRPWEAMGVSLVIHPRNPFVPTVHMNVRCFVAEAIEAGEEDVFWFGGGLDLTPYYPFEEDVRHFHRVCRDALQPFGPDKYPAYKKACDDYFYLKHRRETRGVG